jgi:predicted CXXCH cytochrome family protein
MVLSALPSGARPPGLPGPPDAVAAAPSAAAPGAGAVPRYPLRTTSSRTAALARSATAGDVHGPYTIVADQCAACHRTHTAKAASIVSKPLPQSTLCLTCHDGTGASTDIKARYTDATIPANDAASRAYYRHDALAVTSHTRADLNEFGGVSNRHSECADCHDPHKADTTPSTETANGWTASGRLGRVSAVSVTNGAAGAAPTYTRLTTPATFEYQLCLKCHSGFTQLTSNTGLTPSKYALDKGVEFNPANASYHPVEAPGTNATPKMTANLAGASPYKRWNLTVGSTVRCTNCHADGTTPAVAGTALAPHSSSNRGILLQNYRDRILKSGKAAYAAADFALCYMCHAEQPYATNTSVATNFRRHGFHLTGIPDAGTGGTDIDTPGAGQGNAVCAECHFRLHSSAYPNGTQTVPGTRLVNFSPNVLPRNGVLSWTKSATGGSCTLTCHGKAHNNEGY